LTKREAFVMRLHNNIAKAGIVGCDRGRWVSRMEQ